METRAHFIIIGSFVIFGILGTLAFFLWLASVQIDRQYAQYGVLFDNVSGLDQSADVLFNGVGVGRVVGIRIWEHDPGLAYVSIEIDADTPVRTDTVARLESQGVTGVAYIALAGGSVGAERLIGTAEEPPIIISRRSSLQSLVNDAPDILNDAAELVAQLREITGPENQTYVRNVLQNLDASSASLDTALADFSQIANTVSEATAQIRVFTERLEAIGGSAQTTIEAADTSLAAVTQAFERADEVLGSMSGTIEKIDSAFEAIEGFVRDDVAPLTSRVSTSLTTLDSALASADQAFVRADALMATEIGPALADIRKAAGELGEAMTAMAADAPAVVSEIRVLVGDARAAVALAAPGLRDLGRLGGEARNLVRSFNDLVRRVDRDPARFLLDNRVPDYRK